MADEEETPIIQPINATKWKAMTPAERLAHANQLHQQILEAMKEQEESSPKTEDYSHER